MKWTWKVKLIVAVCVFLAGVAVGALLMGLTWA